MPTIYLSPSTQEANLYVTDGNSEEYYMNLVADAMEPYLKSSGIGYVRNTPQMTAATSIAQSNSGSYDAHFAIHSNAAPDSLKGKIRGSDVYFFPYSMSSKRLADITADNLKAIYPLTDRVRAVPTTYLGEVTRTKAPAVLVELAYHDNEADANWITNNIDMIAQNLVISLTEYFGIPFISPQPVRTLRTTANLNIRNRPTVNSDIKTVIPKGTPVTVYSQYGDWYVVEYDGIIGYASVEYFS